jgi:protein involved in polysaccharide export with SLBB domain
MLGLLLLVGITQKIAMAQIDQGREPEPVVSLSAGAITEILRQELGLLLEVKRLFVRKAYEQGRMLDPADLTDEAVFQLLREDNNARVLATAEIEKREYIRSKPTREEMEKERIDRLSSTETSKASPSAAAAKNEEQRYWAEHEQTLVPKKTHPLTPSGNNDGFSKGAFVDPDPASPDDPDTSPQSNEPAQPESPSNNGRRRQNLVELQRRDGEYDQALPWDAGSLPRISPEGLPGLLSASMEETDGTGQRSPAVALPMSTYSSPSASGNFPANLGQPSSSSSSWNRDTERSVSGTRSSRRVEKPRPQPDEDHPVIRRRVNPYAEVPSLFDLYSQVSRRAPVLARFGEDIFRNGTGNLDQLPMDLPVGLDYVLGPGDGLNIELWGGVSQHLQRIVDRAGRVALPEVGAVEVNGRNLGDVQQLVQNVLRSEFRDVHADVSLARLRTVRVYVVGDVLRPGAYDIGSLSTPLNALYQAGGPTSRGSLRILRHYRGKQLIGEIDLYDLLLHGIRTSLERLQAGDTIMVPPLGAELTVEGMVRRPAIYELNHESDLAEVLELAGGVLNTGTLRHIEVERVIAHEGRSMLRLDLPETNNQETAISALEEFKIQDGDKVRISPVLSYSEQTVYLDGHVVNPGKRAYREGMRVTDLIRSYTDLLPEPASGHAEIIRLAAPDFAPHVIAFNLADALAGDKPVAGNAQDLLLKPFDTVRIFGRFDFEDPPAITVSGEVRYPGEHVTNGETRLSDAVYLAGGITPDALLNDAQVFRKTTDGKLKVLSVNLKSALAGNGQENIVLEPNDRVFVHRNLSKVDPATVKIEGEVARPGKYPLGEDMSAAQLVRLAGGLTRGAFIEVADLTRYTVESGTQVMGEHLAVPLARAMVGEPDSDVRMHDGDVLTVRQLAGWSDVGSLITVKGEVMHPGDYGIQEGERLSSILERAGGFRADAYPYGAILERSQVRELEEKNRSDLIRQVQGEQASFKLLPDTGDTDEKLAKSSILQQWHATLEELQDLPPTGRLVVHVSSDVRKWANTPSDLEIRAGDTLFVPKRPNYVVVSGQVYNPTAITYRPGKNAGWYLRQAGGPNNMASRKAIFVIRADGSVVGGKGGGEWFTGDVLSAELRPGDMVFVPEKALGGPPLWKNTLQAAQLLSSVAVAVSVGHGF